MSYATRHHFSFPQTRVTESARTPLRLTTIVTGLILTLMSLLTGCGSGGETGSDPSAAAPPVATTVSLAWQPVHDHSVMGYFVHYGRHSSAHSGSCTYEHAMYSTDPAATVTNLDPDTRYYFAVSAYNGLESACSQEISTIISSPVI
jgi:fibronectin type III domain protein